jgi:hypothetical protein
MYRQPVPLRLPRRIELVNTRSLRCITRVCAMGFMADSPVKPP